MFDAMAKGVNEFEEMPDQQVGRAITSRKSDELLCHLEWNEWVIPPNAGNGNQGDRVFRNNFSGDAIPIPGVGNPDSKPIYLRACFHAEIYRGEFLITYKRLIRDTKRVEQDPAADVAKMLQNTKQLIDRRFPQ